LSSTFLLFSVFVFMLASRNFRSQHTKDRLNAQQCSFWCFMRKNAKRWIFLFWDSHLANT
jgi:hypothetical protein